MRVAIWTPKAELDLEDILYYIRVNDGRPFTAERIGEEIASAANRQATAPLTGSRHSLAPGVLHSTQALVDILPDPSNGD